MEEIKECPFCGGDGAVYRTGSRFGWFIFVKCETCNSQGQPYFSRENPEDNDWNIPQVDQAIKAWNRRSTE